MIIEVLIELGIKKNDGIFTYKVKEADIPKINIGKRVKVPFNKNILEGYILSVKESSDIELKEIIEVIDDEAVLNKEMLDLGLYMKDKYLASLISCYQVMLPSALKAKNNILINKKEISYITLKDENIDEFIKTNKSEKQNILLKDLKEFKRVLKTNYDNQVVNALIKKNLINIEKEIKNRYEIKENNKEDFLLLNEEQKEVINNINLDNHDTYLLHGITGSGKTEVYLNLIKKTIEKNKKVIVLVPEISLTPQIINKFKTRFDNIAVLHSRLSDGERYDEYRKIVNDEVDIVIGARSAIFAPFTNIGLIIVDEEHEQTYKQESSPRYSAIDIAIKRGQTHNAPVILGSATPSLESYSRSKKGVYKLLEMKNRVKNLKMPKVKIVNMMYEYKKGNTIFSELLKEKIKERLNNNEQVILLLNRRGYSNYLICHSCSYTHKCPNCDITLTYHKTSNNLKCHYCGHKEELLKICPNCKSEDIKLMGSGTEKLEEEIKKEFTEKVIRMDLDTTSKKGSHEKIIESFKNHEYDILLGTQMIAKGLDFDNVTLVGILNSDQTLNLPDFRSAERTFQLLTQASGRSGRNKEGEVIIQTFNDEHYSITTAKNHDYETFYNKELKIRHELKYPPFYYISQIKISSKDSDAVYKESYKIKAFIDSKKDSSLIVLGPTAASVFKVNNIFKFVILIKYKEENKLKEILKNLNELYSENNKINIDIDMNPLKL